MCNNLGVLLHEMFGGFGCLIMLVSSHEVTMPFSTLGPFLRNLIGISRFRPMVSCNHAQLHLYDSRIVPEGTPLSGSFWNKYFLESSLVLGFGDCICGGPKVRQFLSDFFFF